MATIKQFDRTTIHLMRPKLEAAFAALAAEYGIAIKLGNARFDSTNVTFKLELATKSADGAVVSKERAAYTQLADLYDLKPEWLDKTFQYGGTTYKIAGLSTKARKAPVLASNPSGKLYKFNERFVRSLMAPTPFDASLNKAREANTAANAAIVIGPRNTDHDEIERRLTDLRNNNPEAYYADGERRGTQKQIHDELYRAIAREIAYERSGKKPLFGSISVPPPPDVHNERA